VRTDGLIADAHVRPVCASRGYRGRWPGRAGAWHEDVFGIGDRRQSRGGPERLGELGDSRSRAPYHPSRKSIEPGEAMALSTAAPSAATWAVRGWGRRRVTAQVRLWSRGPRQTDWGRLHGRNGEDGRRRPGHGGGAPRHELAFVPLLREERQPAI